MKNTRVTVSICIALSIFLLSIGIVLSRPDPRYASFLELKRLHTLTVTFQFKKQVQKERVFPQRDTNLLPRKDAGPLYRKHGILQVGVGLNLRGM